MADVITTAVRGISLNLVGYTRALELCARMNRETEVLDFIDGIQEGNVLFDLGACEGRFAIYAALRGIRCYAFEPEAMNYKALLQNAELNGQSCRHLLTPFNYAIGASGHRTMIKIGQAWAGGHQKVLSDVASRVDLQFDFTSEQSVDVVSLDEFIVERGLPQPNHLKVDIDGSELSFLKGASRTLKNPHLKSIIFELHEGDASYAEVKTSLASLNFAITGRYEVEPRLFNVLFQRPCALT